MSDWENKAKQEAIEENSFKSWFNNNLLESAEDLAKHGAVNGFSGIIYYSDTVALYDKFSSEIWDKLYDQAEQLGDSIINMISNLKRANRIQTEYEFKNILVWWYCEELAREQVEYKEEE